MQCPNNIIVLNCIKYKKVVNSRMPLLRNLVLVDRFVYPNLFLLILVILCKIQILNPTQIQTQTCMEDDIAM